MIRSFTKSSCWSCIVFSADSRRHVGGVAVNGIVDAVDKARGKPIRNCIVSLEVAREEFAQLNLAEVDAKACFRALKGVGSSHLAAISAVPPIVSLDRNDPRFTAPRSGFKMAF